MTRTPIHPGEILADELKELGLSAAELGRLIEVPANRVSQIVAGKRNITADTALRLGHYFGTSPGLWMNLQQTYEQEAPPRDPTLREHFNTYRFADYKETVIDLLQRVTTVSVETRRIQADMVARQQSDPACR